MVALGLVSILSWRAIDSVFVFGFEVLQNLVYVAGILGKRLHARESSASGKVFGIDKTIRIYL